MKTRYLFGAMALPLVFAACTNDEFEINKAGQQIVAGDMIELPDNFSLVGTKAVDPDTRAGMVTIDNQQYLGWIPTGTADADLQKEDNWDLIGLAWLNVTNDGQVYTNYKFANYGWLKADETKADLDACNGNAPKNGVWYDPSAPGFKDGVSSTTLAFGSTGSYAFAETNFTAAGVDANRGLFRTSAGTIFGGDYLVYYPFNEDLKDIDHLTAISGTSFANKSSVNVSLSATGGYTGDYVTNLAPEFFMVGKTTITGGTQASDFTLGQLSGMIALQVKNETGASIPDIASAVLYAKKGAFYTAVKLDAQKITGSESAAQGAALYYNPAAAETSNTLISKVSADVTLADKEYTVFGFAALPTTIDEYLVIIQDKDGQSVVVEGADPLVVNAGKWTSVSVSIDAPKADVLYAYDEASLDAALTKAGNPASKEDGVTINLIGDVKVGTQNTIPAYVTVKAMRESDKLIVADGKTLSANNNSVLECNVEILGKGCCGATPGQMVLHGTLAEGYTINNNGGTITVNNNGVPTIAGTLNNNIDPDDAESAGKITINGGGVVSLDGTLNNKGDIVINAKTATENDGTLNINGSLVNDGDVTIYGNVATEPNSGKFTNNETVTLKTDGQITGNRVTDQAADAEFICEVNTEDLYENALTIGKTTKIRFVDAETPKDQTYVLKDEIKNAAGAFIDFESKVGNAYIVTLDGKVIPNSNPSKDYAASIGELSVVSGGFVVTHNALTVSDLTVNHEAAASRGFNIEEVVTVTGDVDIQNYNGSVGMQIKKGLAVSGNMTVTKTNGKDIVFAADAESTIGGNMVVGKDGMMKFEGRSVTTIANAFNNEGKVNIASQTGQGTYAAVVYCSTFTHFNDVNYWTNDSYPVTQK